MKIYHECVEPSRDAFEQTCARVEIRFDSKSDVRTALRLLARACLEVLCAARKVDGTHAPAQSRESDGRRWND